MENNKDLILQALNYGCWYVAPTETGYLYLKFPTKYERDSFLERLDKLNIYVKLVTTNILYHLIIKVI